MCYSAMVEADYRNYLRMTGAEMDLDQWREIYGLRVENRGIRIPRGLDRNFDEPRSPKEQAIKDLIDQYRNSEAAKLETELFALKKRLADAERKLQVKETKAAANDKRIATDKIAKAFERLPLLKGTQPHALDGRVFPQNYAPVVIADQGRNVVRLARYHCRQAGKPPSIDNQFPGLYNARRDNLEKFWRNEFGHAHAVMLVHSFFENVDRDGKNVVLHFVPRPANLMLIACLYAEWSNPKGERLLSFAAITDEPPTEVRAAGHDRMIVNLQPANLQRWLTPTERSTGELHAILEDRQRPYYEHQVAA